MKNFIVIDIESDGPCPGEYSMVSFGAVTWEGETFYGEVSPISDVWIPEALNVSGISREKHLTFPDPEDTMWKFREWLERAPTAGDRRRVMWSDNPAFDWQFINYYLHRFTGANPLGFSARRIGDLYAGFKGNIYASNSWKKLRKTRHDHDPVNDAKGNMEALKTIISRHHKNPE